jgi:hypothetical protein
LNQPPIETQSQLLTRITGSVKGLKANTVYRVLICSSDNGCANPPKTIEQQSDANGTFSVDTTFLVQNTSAYRINEIRIIDWTDSDSDRCDFNLVCSTSQFEIPYEIISPTLIPTNPTGTPVPTTAVTTKPTPTTVTSLFPDLAIKTVSRDDQNYYYVQYCNTGKANSSSKLSVSITNRNTGKKFTTPQVMTVPASGQCVFTGGITCGLVGSNCKDGVIIDAVVDSTGTIPEENELNNSASQVFPGPRSTITTKPRVTLTPRLQKYSVTVYAAGTPVRFVYPTMTVELDGKQYYNTAVSGGNFNRRQFAAYSFNTPAIARPKMLTIRFSNDAYQPPQDRNLFIDKVVVNGTTYDLGVIPVDTLGGHTPSTGCNRGRKVTEMMACNGFMNIPLTQ